MYRIKQQQPGYYRALRQNRRVLNRRLKKLDMSTDENMTQSEALRSASSQMVQRWKTVNEASFWNRLKYAITGDIASLGGV